jgi:hypothetical protein
MEEQSPIWKVAANILNKLAWTANKGWSSSLGFGCKLLDVKSLRCYKPVTDALDVECQSYLREWPENQHHIILFFCGKGNANQLETGFFHVPEDSISSLE